MGVSCARRAWRALVEMMTVPKAATWLISMGRMRVGSPSLGATMKWLPSFLSWVP